VALTVDYSTLTINVPQADLTFVSGTFYTLDTNAFWAELKAIEASENGIVYPDMQIRTPENIIAGTPYVPSVVITNGFNVEFEDGQYSVQLENTNNNIWSVGDAILVQNQVQVIPTNSGGLVSGGGGGSILSINGFGT
jgi:hypothetical protein